MLAIFPELVALTKAKDVETLSVRVRQYFGGNEATKPRIDVDDVIQGFGIPCQTAELGCPGALAASDESGIFKVGMFCDVGVIGYQRRFLLGYLLGRYIFSCQPKIANGELVKDGFKLAELPLSNYLNRLHVENLDTVDVFCEDFAAALLMPKGMVIKVYKALKDFHKLGEIFGVPAEVAQVRIELLLGDKHPRPTSRLDLEKVLRGGASLKTSTELVDAMELDIEPIVKPVTGEKEDWYAKSVANQNRIAMQNDGGINPQLDAGLKPSGDGELVRWVDSSMGPKTAHKMYLTESAIKEGSREQSEGAFSHGETSGHNQAGFDGAAESPLQRIRRIAKKIDSSVDSE